GVVGDGVALAVAVRSGAGDALVRERQRSLDRALDVDGRGAGAGIGPRARDVLGGQPERRADDRAARQRALDACSALLVAQRGRGQAPGGDLLLQPALGAAQAPDERIGRVGVVEQPRVAALARGDGGGGQLATEAEAAVTEREADVDTLGDLDPGLLA